MSAIKRTEGGTVSYTDEGRGIPLLFIHGWLMSGRVWALQAPLSDRFRVVTLDLRGHGSATEDSFSYAGCCADIALLLDRLKLERVIVVGWSMGAQIAIKAFPLIKKMVAGMVLVGGTPHFCSGSDFHCGVTPAEARSMALRIKKDYNRAAGEFFKNMFSPEETDKIDMRSLASKVVGSLPASVIALAALNELISSDLRDCLASIFVPVKLVHGVEDRICLPGASEFMAEKIPAATLDLLPSAGHAPFLATPGYFNSMLDNFVQAVHG